MSGQIRVTTHAVERYRERVKPALDYDQAFGDVVRCLHAHAELVEELPGWVYQLPEGYVPDEPYEDCDLVAMVGPDIAFPLYRKSGGVLLAVTCLSRCGLPEGARQHRNRHKAAVRRRRAILRQKQHERALAKRAKRSGTPQREAA